MREHAAAGLHERARGLFERRLRELRAREDGVHRLRRLLANHRRRHAGTNARHHRVPVLEHELQQLALPRRVRPVHRPHAADVADVVPEVRRVVHQHPVAVLQRVGVPVVVHVVDVHVAGGGDRSVAVQARAVDDEDVARGRFELVLLHAGLGAANRLHHPEAGELRRFPDERHLARALHAAQLVENRIEIADLQRAAGQARDELLLPREAAVERVVEDRPIAGAQLAAALRVAFGRLELRVDRLQPWRTAARRRRRRARRHPPASCRRSSSPSTAPRPRP